MKIVYCPAGLRSALEAAGTGLQGLRSVQHLVGIVSPEDVAFYCHVNLHLEQYLPTHIARSFPSLVAVDSGLSASSAVEGKALATVRSLLEDYAHNQNAPALLPKGVPMRLTCDLMGDDVILFSHIPVSADEASADPLEVQQDLFDRFVQQLCTVLSFEKVAATPALAGYLKSTQAVLSASTAA